MDKRHIRIKAQRRRQPDYRKLSRALLELAAAQTEADAAALDRPAASEVSGTGSPTTATQSRKESR